LVTAPLALADAKLHVARSDVESEAQPPPSDEPKPATPIAVRTVTPKGAQRSAEVMPEAPRAESSLEALDQGSAPPPALPPDLAELDSALTNGAQARAQGRAGRPASEPASRRGELVLPSDRRIRLDRVDAAQPGRTEARATIVSERENRDL